MLLGISVLDACAISRMGRALVVGSFRGLKLSLLLIEQKRDIK
jgi:hypothetical protein